MHPQQRDVNEAEQRAGEGDGQTCGIVSRYSRHVRFSTQEMHSNKKETKSKK